MKDFIFFFNFIIKKQKEHTIFKMSLIQANGHCEFPGTPANWCCRNPPPPRKRNMFLFCFIPRFKLIAIANLEIKRC
jgi:hypothetical protein